MAETNRKRAVVFSAVPVGKSAAAYLRPGDFIVACDAGYKNAELLGIVPDLIVGDFDSAPQPAELAEKTIVLPHVKDDTDTYYAARWLVEHGYEETVMLGALGGARLEHTVANIATALFLAKNGVAVCVADEHSELRILLPGKAAHIERADWKYLSLFPLEGVLTGVCEEGVFYPLHNARLAADSSLGVSNEFTAGSARLFCESGCGLIVLSRADT